MLILVPHPELLPRAPEPLWPFMHAHFAVENLSSQAFKLVFRLVCLLYAPFLSPVYSAVVTETHIFFLNWGRDITSENDVCVCGGGGMTFPSSKFRLIEQ